MSKETSCSEPGRASTRILCSPVSALMDRYRKAGVSSLSHHFYTGGRHEMLAATTLTRMSWSPTAGRSLSAKRTHCGSGPYEQISRRFIHELLNQRLTRISTLASLQRILHDYHGRLSSSTIIPVCRSVKR